MSISSVSAVLCSTDGYAPIIFAYSNLTPCFLTQEARRKAAILLMPAFTAGQCIDLSLSGYPSSSVSALSLYIFILLWSNPYNCEDCIPKTNVLFIAFI